LEDDKDRPQAASDEIQLMGILDMVRLKSEAEAKISACKDT
jgi:hypothetical protein